ncbi:uncharacterized protein LOC134668554 [Cydia fagiglandana]|uniref:uncharacterized protein LOC134668554 n=1 Tax=Cydia fagiglandana TaxID=1458189 RepID=UPI002FEE3C6C
MNLLPELDTRTVLHVVQENFQSLGLKTYGIRMIYIGEHKAPREAMIEQIGKTVDAVNGGYCDMKVTGLLLVYDSYFVHIVEGSEDTVHRLLRFLFKTEVDWIEAMERKDADELEALRQAARQAQADGDPFVWPEEPEEKPDRCLFRKLKLLIVYHSIKTFLFKGWRGITARPPSLVGVLDINAPLAQHMEQVKVCLDKIAMLCSLATADDNLSFEGMSAADPKINALPEVALLDLLIQSRHTLALRDVIHLHRRVDDHEFYFEKVWPLPNHFTPRLLYKLKVDDSFVEPLPVMPWEMVKKEKTEEEEDQERQSGSSDSD